MTSEQGTAFLQALGCKKLRLKGNGWIEATCPLAPWTHQKHQDLSPSFALSTEDGGRSFFNCFACRSGSAEELVQSMELYSKALPHQYDFKLAHQMLDEELQVMPLPEFQEHPQHTKLFEEWPEYWIQSFKPIEYVEDAEKYLLGRGVMSWMWGKFNLRYDSQRHMIVAPYRNVFGRFAGARGRSILDGMQGPKKHFDYSWNGRNNAHLVWYGETTLQLPGPVVVVEGQFDCWRTTQAWPKTLANLTAKPTWEKMLKLGDCPFVIHIPDPDQAGEESKAVYQKYCKQLQIGYKCLELPKGEEKIDPAVCHPQYLKDRIEELL